MPVLALQFTLLAAASGGAATLRTLARRPAPPDTAARTWFVLAATFALVGAWLAHALPA